MPAAPAAGPVRGHAVQRGARVHRRARAGQHRVSVKRERGGAKKRRSLGWAELIMGLVVLMLALVRYSRKKVEIHVAILMRFLRFTIAM